jgi:hypothetical protein
MPLAGAAVAQGGTPVDRADLTPVERMSMAFTSHVFETLTAYDGMIAPEDILRLAIIAKQRAVALSCDGYDVNEARFSAAMEAAIGSLIDTETSEGGAITLPFMIAYSGYATLLGGNLALAAYDPDAMCAVGAQLREELSEEGGESIRIWRDAD